MNADEPEAPAEAPSNATAIPADARGDVARLNAWHAFVVDFGAVVGLSVLAWHHVLSGEVCAALLGGIVGARGASTMRRGPPSGVLLPIMLAGSMGRHP